MKTVYLIYGTDTSEPWNEYMLSIAGSESTRDSMIKAYRDGGWQCLRFETWQVNS